MSARSMSSDMGRGIVVIPARNEAATIGQVVRGVLAQGCPAIVVNDDSQDATSAEAHAAGALVLDLPCRLGAWGATQAGLRLALRPALRTERKGERRVIVTLDADGQHTPADIQALMAPVAAGEADIAIGSCPERGSPARQAAWRLFRAISGLAVDDLTSGFRAYSQPAACALLGAQATLADYQDLGVLLLARRRSLRLLEVPVRMPPRAEGRSRIFSSWLKVARYMVYTLTIALTQR